MRAHFLVPCLLSVFSQGGGSKGDTWDNLYYGNNPIYEVINIQPRAFHPQPLKIHVFLMHEINSFHPNIPQSFNSF
jgi:hypothetical protein